MYQTLESKYLQNISQYCVKNECQYLYGNTVNDLFKKNNEKINTQIHVVRYSCALKPSYCIVG